jgi:hypothetical protein
MSVEPSLEGNSVLAGLALLFLRGLLLWLAVPLTVVVWVPASFVLRRRGIRFVQFLGWVDLNLIAFLARTVLRPLFRAPPPWVRGAAMPRVTHRVALTDPM